MTSTFYTLLEPLNLSEKNPVCEIAERKIYRCSYQKFYALRKIELQYTRIYFIKSVSNSEIAGSYLLLGFDDSKKNLEYFEFVKDSDDDREALKYIIMHFISLLGYNLNNYELSHHDNCYYKINRVCKTS